MKKFKKIIALSLALTMGFSLWACGGGDEGTTEATPTEEATGGEDTEAPVTEAELPAETGDPIFVYSWNTELGDRLNYFYEKYPQYKERVQYVNLGVGGTSDEYRTSIEALLQAGAAGTDKYPSIIAADVDVTLNYVESDYTLAMSEIGIDVNDYAKEAYQATIDYATHDGQLKALTWQATPGVFIYRTDIAQEVLGASDPDTVQAAVANMDKFFETAQTMKDAGYAMISGPDDIAYAMMAQKSSPWVTDDKLSVDQAVIDYLETAKKLYDEGFTKKTAMWSDEWNANFDGDVFGWFGCTWFVYWCINAETHAGDFNITQGPLAYHWGGTYLTVAKECTDTALAALVLRTLCMDSEVMAKITEIDSDFVNNKAAVQSVIDAGKGDSTVLGGQNPLPIFMEAAKAIDLSKATAYDAVFKGYVDATSQGYNSGEIKTIDDAVAAIKAKVSDGYSYIVTE